MYDFRFYVVLFKRFKRLSPMYKLLIFFSFGLKKSYSHTIKSYFILFLIPLMGLVARKQAANRDVRVRGSFCMAAIESRHSVLSCIMSSTSQFYFLLFLYKFRETVKKGIPAGPNVSCQKAMPN